MDAQILAQYTGNIFAVQGLATSMQNFVITSSVDFGHFLFSILNDFWGFLIASNTVLIKGTYCFLSIQC